jgi:urease accessory protein UreH
MMRNRREIIMIIVIMKKQKERRVDRGIENEKEVDREKIISIVKVIRRVENMIIIRIRAKNPEEIAADHRKEEEQQGVDRKSTRAKIRKLRLWRYNRSLRKIKLDKLRKGIFRDSKSNRISLSNNNNNNRNSE